MVDLKQKLDAIISSVSVAAFINIAHMYRIFPEQDTSVALSKSEEGFQRMTDSVQRLEEELEVANARWKATQGQLEAAERREKRWVRFPSDAVISYG